MSNGATVDLTRLLRQLYNIHITHNYQLLALRALVAPTRLAEHSPARSFQGQVRMDPDQGPGSEVQEQTR